MHFIFVSKCFSRFLSPSLLPQTILHSSYSNRWTVFDCQNNNNIYISHFMHLTWRFTFCNVNYDSRYHRKYKRIQKKNILIIIHVLIIFTNNLWIHIPYLRPSASQKEREDNYVYDNQRIELFEFRSNISVLSSGCEAIKIFEGHFKVFRKMYRW